ncbi:acyltransferase family protein [Sphaerisporangium sp. NPDC004334]
MFLIPTPSPTPTLLRPQRAAERMGWADTAKGACILLVVLWHVITKHYLRVGWNLGVPIPGIWGMLGDQLLTLRMPLFFTISGMFAAGAFHRPWRTVARGRVARYLYLYVLWVSIHTVLLGFAPGFDTAGAHGWAELAEQLTISPPNLWYLYALALYFALAKALRRVPAPVVIAAALVLSVVVSAGVLPTAGNRGSLLQNLVFFLAGLHLRPQVERFASTTGGRRALPAGLAYALALAMMAVTGTRHLPGVWPTVCVLATVFGVSAAPAVAAVPVIGGALAWLGRRTLAVYLIHMPVLALLHRALVAPLSHAGTQARYVLAVVHPVLMTALVVAVCLLVEAVLRKMGATWLFGLPTWRRARSVTTLGTAIGWRRCLFQPLAAARPSRSRSCSSRTTR